MGRTVTASESITIAAPVEAVWDFTQDYSRRSQWDASILSAQVLSSTPPRKVRIQLRGGIGCEFQYKLEDRPRRTSVAMVDVQSKIVGGGGGSWSYEPCDGGTLWTQVNSITFRNSLSYWCFGMLTAWQLRRGTRKAMTAAKSILETSDHKYY